MTRHPTIDPETDLVLERRVPVPPRLVWKAWTEPEHLKQWFCPRPWRTTECEIDLRPGGAFRTVMEGPNGERFDNTGCFLEIVPERKLVFTDALGPGFRPNKEPFFTAIVLIEPDGDGAKYTAIALHADGAARKKHADMGFHDGWGKALDQLVEVAQGMR
jgi:uncharacterized protein YndB with AHSA1/START domain